VLFNIAAPAYPKYGGGTGEPNDPYLILDANQMNAIGADSNDWDKHFKLVVDINLADYTGTQFNIIENFTGVFDGNGHTISNFTYSSPGAEVIGLFRHVNGPNAEIKDLGLINPYLEAGTYLVVGSLVGRMETGVITNCYVEGGSVSGDFFVGGLVGVKIYGTITNCYSDASVSGNEDVGGLVGYNRGTIYNCYSTGSISGQNDVGGLVGYDSVGIITNCYSKASVSGNNCVGGLVGYVLSFPGGSGTIYNCYSTGSVSGNEDIGGLVGYSMECYYNKSFWDYTVNPSLTGIGNITDPPDVIGESTRNMQTQSNYTDAGWDFVGETTNGTEDIWTICEAVDYPKLKCQFVIGDFDGDDNVDFTDFAMLATRWLKNGTSFYCGGGGTDLTNDGDVDSYDLKEFADNWLRGF
jgi:hypothetical protein